MLLIFTLSMAFMVSSLTAYIPIGAVIMSVASLALTLTCLFVAALVSFNREKMFIGLMIAVFVAIVL